MGEIKKRLNLWVQIFLAVLFCLINAVAVVSMLHMQGNARVVNYTGIVRGATQRLVKLEINGTENDKLMNYLDGIVAELSTGEGENNLIAIPDDTYQELMGQMRREWDEIKTEIIRVRQGADSQRLFGLSEDFFELANDTVSAAERYSESRVSNTIGTLICLDAGFILLFILLGINRRRREKVQLALESAQQANLAKSSFLSQISHEIRTPMNGIIGMTAIARKHMDDPEKLGDCLDKIDLSSGYLLSLLNDVLDMSRIESGKLVLEHDPFDLTEVFERIAVMFRQKAEDSGIRLKIQYEGLTATHVVGDNLRLCQILVNLVSNALKFTPSGGCVVVEARELAVSDADVSLEFKVMDSGIGISDAFQEHIFDPFEQELAGTARQYGGTGLGLAISSNFIRMMGGKISVHSQLGKGATFIVDVTLERAAPESVLQAASAEEQLLKAAELASDCFKDKKILLAEDNDINAEIVAALLEERGVRVDLARNGKTAIEQFRESPEDTYALILMDIQMPVMDGLEATRTIRALERTDARRIPIIGLSANAFAEDVDKALKSGMNGYLAKPIVPEQLYQTLSEALVCEMA